MTCAACVARVEKALNAVDGVTASVSLATERARVQAPAGLDDDALVQVVRAAGYDAVPASAAPADDADAAARVAAALRLRLIWAVALSVPVLAVSMIPPLQFPGWQWASLVLATPVVWWCGWAIHVGAWRALMHRSFSMDSLVSLGSGVSWAWSVVAVLFLGAGEIGMTMHMSLFPSDSMGAEIYFEVAAGIVALVLLGRFLEARARRSAGEAIRSLMALAPDTAMVLRGHAEVQVPAASVQVGEVVVVRPGDRIPVDGEVQDGMSAVDRALLTGESVPVEVGPGDPVEGGALNAGGRITVRATRVGSETAVHRVAQLVEAAQAGKAPVQRLADRVAGVFVPVVILIAVGTLVGWLALGNPAGEAMTAAVAVLVISCPCALGLATPAALMVGTGRGAELGILIRGPEVLESTRRVTVAVLDKTGTLTEGVMAVAHVAPAPGWDADRVLALAGAAEAGSEHPIGRAIAEAASRARPLAAAGAFRSQAGLGVSAQVDGHQVEVWRSDEVPAGLEAARDAAREQGRTVVAVRVDGQVAGLVAVSDVMRPETPRAMQMLRDLGLRTVMLTGDAEAPARAVAEAAGIDQVVSGVLPDGKERAVRELQEAGEVVAMAGDGVNDAPALVRADLGIAIGTGTDVATEAADITLVTPDPRAIADAIRLSRRTLRTIQGNLAWAFGYNVAAIPLAVLGLLNPLIAAAAMGLSSIFVVTNSLRLKGFKPAR
ncbi:MAG: cadmium-translocating P-type ATPase [Thermoleophilia bacterium]|nr:cadmium-translocating P-type ATPase [Thermoleophilia bacterium]